MSEMIERVARAIAKFDPLQAPWGSFVDCARAVLAAMRDPTNAMIVAGADDAQSINPGQSYAVWTNMIDEALRE